MAKTYKIAVIPGDGIGKEVTPWAQKALEKAAEGVADFEYENFDLGAERYLRDGAILPEDEEERIKANDAILLGRHAFQIFGPDIRNRTGQRYFFLCSISHHNNFI